MANDYYKMLEPGEPINWDATPRLEEEKFAFPENKDEYPLEDPASEFPDQPPKQIDTLQAINQLKNLGLDVGGSLEQDAPDRLLNESPYFPTKALPAIFNAAIQNRDPISPQGMEGLPFSQYMQARPTIVEGLHKNRRIEDIIKEYVNNLTKPKTGKSFREKQNLKTYKGR